MKYDRRGYKPRERILLIGSNNLYLLDPKTIKLKHKITISKIPKVVVTKESDNLMLIRIPLELKKDKGDLILDLPHVIECCMWISKVSKYNNIVEIMDSDL